MSATDAATKFRSAHAAHANWRMATERCLAQLDAQTREDGFARRANLGFLYMTDAFSAVASEILTFLKVRTGVHEWVGTVGVGVCASGVEYHDEGAMVVMLADLPAHGFSVVSGEHPPPSMFDRTPTGAITAHAALVHADPTTPDLQDLVVDMAGKVESGWLFGGLASARDGRTFQIANRTLTGGGHEANVYGSGLSGVVFSSEVHLASRVTQGCHPVEGATGGTHAITAYEDNQILALDGSRALDVLLSELGVGDSNGAARVAHLAGGVFVGLSPPGTVGETRFGDLLMRQVISIDPERGAVGVAAMLEPDQRLTFCVRDPQAARADLVRICRELRAEVRSESPALEAVEARGEALFDTQLRARGAIYVSCLGRGEHMFGERGAELALIREQLGDVPLVGFFANGEIARSHVHGYTGVLTLFL